MTPVIQRERTGCGIAAAAALAGLTYARAKSVAAGLGISAADERLWSETGQVRRLLRHLGIQARRGERRFSAWEALPDLALLAVKWHVENARPCWHWVVFVRDARGARVLDSKKGLRRNARTDFGRMRPKWFIAVSSRAGAARTSRRAAAC